MEHEKIRQYLLDDDGIFPNSKLPVLHYMKALQLPLLFRARYITRLFKEHGWTNSWTNGIYTYHHYHSITHEAMAVIKGRTTLLLGGYKGQKVMIEEGDVIIIPAGVAHKNLGREEDVVCVGAYPDGKDFDMNHGRPGERPQTDKNIAALPIPNQDPIYGLGGLVTLWEDWF